MVRFHTGFAGAGAGARADGATCPPSAGGRYTTDNSSTTARPDGPKISFRTVVNTMRPERPSFGATSATVETRLILSPTRSGAWNVVLVDAHIRRGNPGSAG